ncbi:MAG: transposase [Lachnospiraceae bacterium]|nr:transposase [Lachnospiraceae bacterium]
MPRKSKYESNILPRLDEIEAWARDGVPEEDMARRLNVAYSTFRKYKEMYSALSAPLARTREYVDLVEMVGAYKKRAMGYEYTETKKIFTATVVDGKEVRQLKEIQETKKHVPGDPRAMENWLRIRQPELWGQIQAPEGNTPALVMNAKEELIEAEVIESEENGKPEV